MSSPPSAADVFLIRAAARSDLPTLLEFRMGMIEDIAAAGQAQRPWDPDAVRQANGRWLAEHFDRDFAAWLAEIGGRPAGTAAIMWFPHPPGPRNLQGVEAYVLNVYTKLEFRRRGIARALMARVIEEARARGIGRIWLRASREGRPLYEAIGFGASNYLELAPEIPAGQA
ncbi:MAG TPA: GNAT family N-acetyltransferase [Candidatus Limnocylindrales bacterium]|jgi:GNAT superfamily N-acetyltransferase